VRVVNSIGIGFPPIDLMGRFYVELCFFSRITDETPYVLNEKIGRDEGNFVSFSREEGYGQPSPRPQTMRPRWTKLRWPNIHCNLQGPHQVDWILLNFTGFSRVLPGFTWFLLGFQKVPLRWTGLNWFYRVLLGFAGLGFKLLVRGGPTVKKLKQRGRSSNRFLGQRPRRHESNNRIPDGVMWKKNEKPKKKQNLF